MALLLLEKEQEQSCAKKQSYHNGEKNNITHIFQKFFFGLD